MTDHSQDEMPLLIWAWMGMQDNGSWDKTPCPCDTHESIEYIRRDATLTPEQVEKVRRALEGLINAADETLKMHDGQFTESDFELNSNIGEANAALFVKTNTAKKALGILPHGEKK